MNETPDPLETELLAIHPRPVSAELRQHIAGRLAGSTTQHKRPLWQVALGGGLAATCLAALFLARGGGRPAVVGPLDVRPGRTEDELPSLRAYRQALARSPEDLDALLDRHTARGSRLNSQLVRIRAFNRPDLEVFDSQEMEDSDAKWKPSSALDVPGTRPGPLGSLCRRG
jgi:hypothetical protein